MNKTKVIVNGNVEILEKRLSHFNGKQKMIVEFISTYYKKGSLMIKRTKGIYWVGKVYKSTSDTLKESPYQSVVKNKIKQHTNGNYYLELHTIRNYLPIETTYTINGVVVDKETYNSLLPPSKVNAKPKKYFIVKAENVISIQ